MFAVEQPIKDFCSICYEDFIHILSISKEDLWQRYQGIVPNRNSLSLHKFALAQCKLYGLIIDDKQTQYTCTTPQCDAKICGSCFDKLTTNKPSYTTYGCTHCKARNWNSHMKKPIQNHALRVRQRDDIFEHLWDSYQRV